MIFAVPFGDGIRSGVGEIKGWKYDIPKSDFAIGMIDKKLQINEINVKNSFHCHTWFFADIEPVILKTFKKKSIWLAVAKEE